MNQVNTDTAAIVPVIERYGDKDLVRVTGLFGHTAARFIPSDQAKRVVSSVVGDGGKTAWCTLEAGHYNVEATEDNGQTWRVIRYDYKSARPTLKDMKNKLGLTQEDWNALLAGIIVEGRLAQTTGR